MRTAILIMAAEGWRSLAAHRLRSTLSMLGVVLGVAALIAMTAVSEGARRVTVAQIEALGTRNVVVEYLDAEGTSRVPARGSAVLHELSHRFDGTGSAVARVVPIVLTNAEAHSSQESTSVRVVGTTRAYQTAFTLAIDGGRFLTDMDDPQVVVLGAAVARTLFPAGTALGNSVRIGRDVYTVVGTLRARSLPRSGSLAIPLQDTDSTVFVPLEAVAGPLLPDGTPRLTGAVVHCARTEHVAQTAAALRRFVEESGGSSMFNITVGQELLRQTRRAHVLFNAVMLSIAAIGLVVGGIGVMNVMLVSVTERVQEVGIRRAVGAKRSDVMLQFLVEAVVLCLGGGTIGVAIGAGAAAFIAATADWPVAVRPHALVAALLVSGLTGLIFGSYPAYVASRMPPAEAIGRT